jgi:pyruvate formate lyase activating enzyme
VEVTTLVIPQKNDSRKELEDIAGFIAGVDKSIPWHVSRFHPDYKLTHHHVTPEATLEMARSVGFNAGLKFVYAGNISGWGNDTLCPKCEELLVKRENLKVYALNIEDGRCQFCKAPIAGVWS